MTFKIRLMSTSKRELEQELACLNSVLPSSSPVTKGRLGEYLCYAELAIEGDRPIKLIAGTADRQSNRLPKNCPKIH
ncbi:MAG: hypothetical protein M3Q07_12175 [Pseudobdellovibrionaceae bacterium]|nr:hypothetical protein [Pseudobdellovibrionaceae bacterium]